VRSATVRNELAEMSEMGYLDQPHTSAGRIPSDQGYRYFVDHMFIFESPDSRTQNQVAATVHQGEVLQVLLTETTAMLSRISRLMSAAVTVSDQKLLARSAMVTALGPESALLVLVLGNGHVQNRLLSCPPGLTLDELGRVNEVLSDLIRDRSLAQIAKLKLPEATGQMAYDKLATASIASLKQMARDLTRGKITVDGEEFLFAQPEFQRDPKALEAFFASVHSDDSVLSALQDPERSAVTIGGENTHDSLRPFSVIRQRFFIGSEEAGTIALIGPTRLDYTASIPLVDFTAQAISQTLTKLLKGS
jgi:heat-inducible transcriptional repressor